jgi:hypothetical protein
MVASLGIVAQNQNYGGTLVDIYRFMFYFYVVFSAVTLKTYKIMLGV